MGAKVVNPSTKRGAHSHLLMAAACRIADAAYLREIITYDETRVLGDIMVLRLPKIAGRTLAHLNCTGVKS